MFGNTTQRSTILLLCLGLDTELDDVKRMTVHDIHKIFKVFGTLKKIIIFSKKDIVKAFLEYQSFSGAIQAKTFVHESFMNNYGRARLYYSAMNELKFSNRYLEYWDYTQKNNNFTDLSTEVSSIQNPMNDFTKKDSIEILDNKVIDDKFNSFDSIPPLSIDNVFVKSNSFSEKNQYIKIDNKENISNNQQNISQLLKPKVKPSKVILISNLNNCFKNVDELYNFFCCYGDIVKVLYMVNLGKAMIQFTRFKYSAFCVKNINNLEFMNTIIKINYSKYQQINLNNKKRSNNSISFNQTRVIKKNENFYDKELITSSMMPSKSICVVFDRLCRVNVYDMSNFLENLFSSDNFDILNLSTIQMRKFNIKFTDSKKSIDTILKLNNKTIRNSKIFMYFS